MSFGGIFFASLFFYDDIYEYELPIGEEVTTDLIYVVEDTEVVSGIHFLLEYNPCGASLEAIKPKEYSMIYLKSMEDMQNEITTEE